MKRLIKHLSIYGFGAIFTNAISFLLLPVYARVLVPEEYGSLTLVNIVGSVLAVFYGLMISSGFIRLYFDRTEEEYRSKLFGTTLWFTLVCVITFGVTAYFHSQAIASRIFEFSGGDVYIRLVAISIALFSCSSVFYGLLMVRERSRAYVTVNVITLVLILTLTIVFLVVFRMSIYGVFLAQVIGRLAELLILSVMLLNRKVFRFSTGAAKEMLLYSGPLVPVQLSFIALTLADRFFIQAYQDVSEVGLYSIGYKIASVLPILIVQPLKAWGPHIYSLSHNEVECKATMARFLRMYTAVVLVIALVISVFAREALMIIADPEYWDAWKVVGLLSCGYVLFGMMNVLAFGFHIVKMTWLLSIIDISGGLVNVGLNFLLVPKYGMTGAAVASMLSYTFTIIVYAIMLNRVYPLKIEYWKMTIAFIAASLVYYATTYLHFGFAPAVAAKIALLVVVVWLLLRTRYFSNNEKRQVGETIRATFKRMTGSGKVAV